MLISFDPGGEIYVPFAKRKLELWKAEAARAGVGTIHKRVDVSDGSTIYVDSTALGRGQYNDRIRITGGFNGRWMDGIDWYYNRGSQIVERTRFEAPAFHDWNKKDRLTEVKLSGRSGAQTLTISRRVNGQRVAQSVSNVLYRFTGATTPYLINGTTKVYYPPCARGPWGEHTSNVGGRDQVGVYLSFDGKTAVARSAVIGETFVVLKWNSESQQFDEHRVAYPARYLALKAALPYVEATSTDSPHIGTAGYTDNNYNPVALMFCANAYSPDTVAFLGFQMQDGSVAYTVTCVLDIATLEWATLREDVVSTVRGTSGPLHAVCCRTDGSWFFTAVNCWAYSAGSYGLSSAAKISDGEGVDVSLLYAPASFVPVLGTVLEPWSGDTLRWAFRRVTAENWYFGPSSASRAQVHETSFALLRSLAWQHGGSVTRHSGVFVSAPDSSCKWFFDYSAGDVYVDGELVYSGTIGDGTMSAERPRLFRQNTPPDWFSLQETNGVYSVKVTPLPQYSFLYLPDETIAVVPPP